MPVLAAILSLPDRGFPEGLAPIVPLILIVLPITLILTCLLSGMPSALVIWLGESLRIRSVLFYAAAGAAIGALIANGIFGTLFEMDGLFALAGCLAGVAYWSAAGKDAGAS
ncbi:hypothetical protein WN72_29370 [Bradyrhizobium arachidis]|uniref:Uncharacterized protein n=1 Tax=Bradyrhizobium arachidis TaxID=858423 RepID=A0AAE7TI23_9BRAD|nr:hypothetical protein WN72_29370 [Bradyrhizobium arachidis]